MLKVESHRDLLIWQKAMDMVVQVYKIAGKLPAHEKSGIVSQVTRAAVSVPANIAEGNSRGSPRDFAHFIAIARGSLVETDTLLALAVRLEYISVEAVSDAAAAIEDTDRMLCALKRKLLA